MSTLPATYRKCQVVKKVTDPHEAIAVVEAALDAAALPQGAALLKVVYAGVNATDMNQFLGAYGGGEPPFDCGLEGLGTVVALGPAPPGGWPRGCAVGATAMGTGVGFFAEYRICAASDLVFGVPLDPKFLTIPISALTAAIAVGELGGRPGSGSSAPAAGEVALVTAAAGGTGQFAVQWLKKVCGCKVIATCSSAAKVSFLKALGADRVVNYNEEELSTVLAAEYPSGVDVVYESVGGDTFEAALKHLAPRGRLIVIGAITGYKDQTAFRRDADAAPIQRQLLTKSGTMHGFLLPMFKEAIPRYLPKVLPMVLSEELQCHVDTTGSFKGPDDVAAAVAHLHAGGSFGKVVVHMAAQ